MNEIKDKIFRRLTGEVVSVAMDKTAVVRVDSVKTHKVYGKKIKSNQKYKIHDEKQILCFLNSVRNKYKGRSAISIVCDPDKDYECYLENTKVSDIEVLFAKSVALK